MGELVKLCQLLLFKLYDFSHLPLTVVNKCCVTLRLPSKETTQDSSREFVSFTHQTHFMHEW